MERPDKLDPILAGLPPSFTVSRKLGAGGMASVYLATDARVQREVALKILHPHLRDDPLVVERFRREIAAARRIQHPNVVMIHDLIETDELSCLVLEFHPGGDLKQRLRRSGAQPLETTVALLEQVLSALDAAHRQGVIHRDIKPHNVLVDDEGRIKLTDFGLARVDDLIGVTTHTMTLGTPEYMAPELLGGGPIDGRADLYGVGVMLYELVTGTLPFRADTPLALLQLHQRESPPDPRDVDDALPGWITHVIQRAMAKEPDDRFATAAQMLAAVRARGEGDAVRPPMTPGADAAKPCARCGAALLLDLEACLECGHERLTVQRQRRRGHVVAFSGSLSSNRDSLTFRQKADTITTLETLGGHTDLTERQLDARLRRTPVVLADHLTSADADAIVQTLRGVGVAPAIYAPSVGAYVQQFLFFAGFKFLFWISLACMIGTGFVLSALADSGIDAWQQAFYGLLILGGSGFGTARRLHKRTRPLVRFAGEQGGRATSDALLRRSVEVFAQVQSPRLRGMLRRILARGIALQRAIEARGVRDELAEEVERALTAALDQAAQIAHLEAQQRGVSVADIHEAIQRIDARIEVADIHDTADLLDEKVTLRAQLAEHDERQDEVIRRSHRLLEVSAQLATLSDQAHSLERFDEDTLTSMSAILEDVHLELAAHQELERDLKGLPPAVDEDEDIIEVVARGRRGAREFESHDR